MKVTTTTSNYGITELQIRSKENVRSKKFKFVYIKQEILTICSQIIWPVRNIFNQIFTKHVIALFFYVFIFYTVFIDKKRKVENKYPFLDRNKLGCIENIEERRQVLKREDYVQFTYGDLHALFDIMMYCT